MKRPPFLHRTILAGARAFNRNPWSNERIELVPRNATSFFSFASPPFYEEDGVWTNHGHTFVDEARFQQAYGRAVGAGGFDYHIRWRVHTILWAACTAARVDGAFVECGTGRGFMASAICEYLAWDDRPFYLYDTFEPSLAPGLSRQPMYASGVDDVRENFREWPGIRLVVGKLPGTLSTAPDQVAFLHVDLNQAPPESAAVRHFWPRMPAGAVLIYDDYGFPGYEEIRRAANEVAAELGFSILCSPTGQGIVVKPAVAS